MKITVVWLKVKKACQESIDLFQEQKETDSIKILQKLITQDKLDWANWLIVRVMAGLGALKGYRMYVSYAVYSAEQVIDSFEKKYPDNKGPRKAIEAAKKCINNPSKENKCAAESAAWSAAESAAWSAAWSAESAAWSAAWSAESAAWNAAESAAESAEKNTKMKLKILKYGLKILKGDKID